VTWGNGIFIRPQQGCTFTLSTNTVMTFVRNDFAGHSDKIFFGLGTVTGTVYGVDGCFTNWNALTYTNLYYLNCLGYRPDLNYLDKTTVFAGDVFGTWNTLAITPGTIGAADIADGSVTSNELANSGVSPIDLDTNGLVSLIAPLLAPVWFDAEQVITQSDAAAPATFDWTTFDLTQFSIPSNAIQVGGECRISATDTDFGRLSWYTRRDDDMTELVPTSVLVGGTSDVTNDTHTLWVCPVSSTNTIDIKINREGFGAADPDFLQYHFIMRWYLPGN
jgi:hypothetical protein